MIRPHVKELLQRCRTNAFERDDIITLLSLSDSEERAYLLKEAYSLKCETVKPLVRLRGIIEFSNVCVKNCYYCGIRKSNTFVERFTMQKDEILAAAQWAFEQGYGSIVLQSGERSDANYIDFVEECLRGIKKLSDGALGITLSLGEQSKETYKRWYKAGAHRYLLRIESSNPELYARIHPEDHDFDTRKACLSLLRDVGYQVGTGVMIGLPGQSMGDLADDILYFKECDIDMIGMGPYLAHPDTPLVSSTLEMSPQERFDLSLRMIALTRLVLKDVNIAATTALQAIDPTGREKGIKAGANVIMPNISDVKYRDKYHLYAGKPCADENADQCRGCLEERIKAIGEKISYNQWGDSPHYMERKKND